MPYIFICFPHFQFYPLVFWQLFYFFANFVEFIYCKATLKKKVPEGFVKESYHEIPEL